MPSTIGAQSTPTAEEGPERPRDTAGAGVLLRGGQVEDQVGFDEGAGRVVHDGELVICMCRDLIEGNLALATTLSFPEWL